MSELSLHLLRVQWKSAHQQMLGSYEIREALAPGKLKAHCGKQA